MRASSSATTPGRRLAISILGMSFAQFSLTQVKEMPAELPNLSSGSEKLGDLWKAA